MKEKRTIAVRTWLLEEESDLIKKVAEQSGYSQSTIIRQCVIKVLEDPDSYNVMFGFNPIRMAAMKRMTKYRKPV